MAPVLAAIDRTVQRLLLPLTAAGLAGGLLAMAAGATEAAWWCWTLPAVVVGAWLAASIVRDLRAGQAGVDIIALLAIVGALLVGESLAAAVIAVMLATGAWLERYAEGRAHRELTALVSRAPRTVHRHEAGAIVDHPIEVVAPGDRLLVKPGEVVPVDGMVAGATATLDESALTGESRMVVREAGDRVLSGTVNAGTPFDLVASATADASTYAGIVRLVEAAAQSKAPFVRLADRYALLFVPLALGVAGLAWLATGDPVRALAVLVVATPCPLLLAAPIAIVAGISRSARRGIIVKGGGALEAIARARVMLFDKTGTLTAGRPHLADVVAAPGQPRRGRAPRGGVAGAGVAPRARRIDRRRARRSGGVALVLPEGVEEVAGAGVRGSVDGRAVRVGTAAFAAGDESLPPWARDVRRRVSLEGATSVFVAAGDRSGRARWCSTTRSGPRRRG